MIRLRHIAVLAALVSAGALSALPLRAQTTSPAPAAPAPAPPANGSTAYPSAMEPITGPIRSGDTLNVLVVGEPAMTGYITVDPEGNIALPLAGQVKVQALSASKAAETIAETLKRQKLLVRPQVTVLIAARPARMVSISGAVTTQGQVKIKEGTRLNEVVEPAGMLPTSDPSKIVITRGEQRITVDYLPYRSGSSDEPANNPMLEDGDRIFIYSKVVVEGNAKVVGEVKNPTLMAPVTAGITASQLIAQAGGATETADKESIYIQRGQERIPVPLKAIQESKAPDIPLQDGDQVVIPRAEKPKTFMVTGAVYRPETYPMERKTTLLEAVNRAGGFVEGAKVKEVQVRKVAEGGPVETKKFNLENAADAGTVVEPGDNIFVPYPSRKQRFGPMEAIPLLTSLFWLFR